MNGGGGGDNKARGRDVNECGGMVARGAGQEKRWAQGGVVRRKSGCIGKNAQGGVYGED